MEKHSSLFIRTENCFVLVGIGLVGSANKKFGDWTCLAAKFIKTFFLSHFLWFFYLRASDSDKHSSLLRLELITTVKSFIVQAQLKPIV